VRAASRRRRGADAGHGDNERWLLTYSDMITLLMALFIVMWAISSVNVSKFDQLKASLRSAFSGRVVPADVSVLTGQTSPLDHDGTPIAPPVQPGATPPVVQVNSLRAQISARIASAVAEQAARADLDNLRRIAERIHAYAREHHFDRLIRTRIEERGLVVRLLTDGLLFDSGRAVLKHEAVPLLRELASLLAAPDIPNPVRVEGNTDDVPIHSPLYPSNWELSTARATAVLEFLLAHGVAPRRLSATGYGDQNPVASNATAAGHALNRRVDVVILRRSFSPKGS